MSPVQITLYSFIGIGLLACISALIYTKLIKPNTFGYTNKNIVVKKQYSDLIKKLNSQSKVWNFEDLVLVFEDDNNQTIIIEQIFVTLQNAFILSKPLEKKVVRIELDNNQKYKLVYKKKKLDLPMDVNLLLSSSKRLKNKIPFKENLKIIIPVANSEFVNQRYNNIYFVSLDSLYDEIQKIEKEPSQFEATKFVEFIKKYSQRKKSKRTFMNIKFKKDDSLM